MTNVHWSTAIDNYCLLYYDGHLLYALLHMTTLINTIANKKNILHTYYNKQLMYATLSNFYELLKFQHFLYTPLQITTEVWSVSIDKFCTDD